MTNPKECKIQLASIGDTIECDVTYPHHQTLSAKINTPNACAMANDVLMDKSSGWRLVAGKI